MPRLARVVLPGFPHYITQRARSGETLFHSSDDYRAYLDRIVTKAARYGVRLLGYCLLPDRVGWVAIPEGPQSLAMTFGRAHSEYAQARHRQLWRDRFDSRALDNALGWRAVLFIERWPVRFEHVEGAEQWMWSSARAHTGNKPDVDLDLDGWRAMFSGETWETVLEVGLGEEGLAQRLKTRDVRTARPAPLAAAAPV
jgi:putative transposase